jgi:uncharacterized protein YecE (DUF72 family)
VKRPLLKPAAPVLYRHAFEVRHPSFFTQQFYDQLGRHGAALVIADTAGKFPYDEHLTTDFVYVRLHGSQALYASAYTDEELDAWAGKIEQWDRDTYVYFDNDALAEAPHNALGLARRVTRAGTADVRPAFIPVARLARPRARRRSTRQPA